MIIRKCIMCEQINLNVKQPCYDCYQSLPWHVGCDRCGNPTLQTEHGILCKHCLLTPPPFQQLISAWHYTFPIDAIISQFKFSDQLHWQKFLSQGLITNIRQRLDFLPPDCIVPMPLHLKRLRQRGYNQARLIAKPIAKQLKITLDDNLCFRHKSTKPQVDLSEKLRHTNVKNAFNVTKSLHNKRIAIIDDVVTTGSTVASLSQALLDAGAAHIQIWCLAKTSCLSTDNDTLIQGGRIQ